VTDLSLPPTARSARLALRDIGGISMRNPLRIIRTPQWLFVSLLQPTIIPLFRYLLSGAIRIPGLDYVDFVVPGIFLEAMLIGGMTTALALAQDPRPG
jgi:ABC-2 type transport system permease protein